MKGKHAKQSRQTSLYCEAFDPKINLLLLVTKDFS